MKKAISFTHRMGEFIRPKRTANKFADTDRLGGRISIRHAERTLPCWCRKCVIGGAFLVFITLTGFAQAQFPYQPVGLMRYCMFERNVGPWESIHAVGDQNGDGYIDFISRVDGGRYVHGSYLFYGGPEIDSLPDVFFDVEAKPCGDVSGDGIIDFLTNDPNDAHKIIMFGGNPRPRADFTPPYQEDHPGLPGWIPIGDVNHDRLGDFIVWREYYNDSLQMGMDDYIILLGGGRFDRYADWRIATDTIGERYFNLQTPIFGDMNGNGEIDVLEHRERGANGDFAAKFYCVHDCLTDSPDTTDFMDNFPNNEYLPRRYNFIKDVNDDGCDELIVTYAHRSEFRFQLHFYLGGADPDAESDFSFETAEGAYIDASNVGDLNGDGYSDLALSMAAGQGAYWAYLYLGGPDFDDTAEAIIVSPFEGVRYDNGLGYRVRGIGDYNNNGYDDILVLSQPENSEMRAVLVISLDAEFASVKDPEQTIPKTFGLVSVFPNPFNNSLNISLDRLVTGEFMISLADITGRHVWSKSVLLEKENSLAISASTERLSSGIYFIRCSHIASNRTVLKKAVLLR